MVDVVNVFLQKQPVNYLINMNTERKIIINGT